MSNATSAQLPSEADQLQFLASFQRLLGEGQFVATYKFALLIALADLAIERGRDDALPLNVPLEAIAEKFLFYYWGQTRPYVPPGSDGGIAAVLLQNTGKQAAVISRILSFQESSAVSFSAARKREKDWRRLLTAVSSVVEKMPLWRLQVVGDTVIDFLYAHEMVAGNITLRPGIGFCLRRFYPLVIDLVRGAWLAFVRRQNHGQLGASVDLDEFLFGSSRRPLDKMVEVLVTLQARRCFYCQKEIAGTVDVDHFVPWSRYSFDFGHNFVVAHPACNRSKSDHIAAVEHLERWWERNVVHDAQLKEGLGIGGVLCDIGVTRQVTSWAYGQAESIGERGWLRGDEMQAIGGSWRDVLG